MPLLRRRPLAILVCCLFTQAQMARAAAEIAELAPHAAGQATAPSPEIDAIRRAATEPVLKLKVERKMLSLLPKGLASNKENASPAFIMADQIEGRTDELTVAEGSVEVRKLDSQLFADRVDYRPLEDEVDAVGNVVLLQYDDEMRGPHLRMKLSEKIGFFEEVDYKVKREVPNRFYQSLPVLGAVGTNTAISNAPMMLHVPSGYDMQPTLPARRPSEMYGHSRKIDFEGENKLTLNDATYSSCKPGKTDWYMRADDFHLDYDSEDGEGRNATLYFKDVPVFHTPYVSFSLNNHRKSGFLSPSFSASTKNGLDLTLPYYWNLAPNYDLTLFPREIAKRGLQYGSEVRYADHNFSGTTRLEYLPDDQLAKRDRWAYNLVHVHNLGQGLSASLNLNGVSDNTYWGDLSSRLLQTTQTQLPKQLSLGYSPGSWWSSSLTWLRYQTLQTDPTQTITRPYFLEPQINFTGRLPDLHSTDFTLLGQYSQFTHPTLVEGGRAFVYPQLSLPYFHPAFSITPKIGLHATQYALHNQVAGQPSSISRVIPTLSVDSTVVFERDMQWLGRDHVQTLEPRLYYVNIPYRDQSRIPVFDSGLADFNFAQIFTENRFAGYDRINDANQLTAAVTSRVFDATSGAERFKVMFGQRYYFRDQRVVLPGETLTAKKFSNSLLAFNGLILPKTYLDSALEYNNREGRTDRFSIGSRYQPDNAKVLSASYRFVRNGVAGVTTQVKQMDLAGQWPISDRWYAVGRYNYSLRDKKLLEAVAGVEYNAGCWAARLVAQRLEAVAGTPNTTVFFQLELNDFASIGSNPIQLLRRSVPGFGKVNELPTSGSLLTSE